MIAGRAADDFRSLHLLQGEVLPSQGAVGRQAGRDGDCKILVAVFHILAEGTEFRELGPAHLDQLHKHRVTKGLVRRLDALGSEVILRPKLAA